MKWLLLLVVAVLGACSDDAKPLPQPAYPPVPIAVTLNKARDRIYTAEKQLAEAYRFDDAEILQERLAFLQRLAAERGRDGVHAGIEGDSHEDAPGPPASETNAGSVLSVSEWRAKYLRIRISDLEQRLQEYLLRGSTHAYRAAATIDVEMLALRELAANAGLPRDAVPDDPLELLDVGQLAVLDDAWQGAAKEHEATAARIGLSSEAQEAATETITKQRKRISDARARIPTAFAQKLEVAPARSRVEDASWLQRREDRDHLITIRERELLQHALARDGSDVPALRRLAEIDATPIAVSTQIRAAALDRTRASIPASVVSEKLSDRLFDPIRAAWRDALLDVVFERDVSSNASSKPDRTQWEFSFLDDSDLAERFEWLHQAVSALDAVDARVPWPLQREMDRAQVRADYEAVKREIARRRQGSPHPLGDAWTTVTSTYVHDDLLADVPTPADIEKLGPAVQHAFWNHLERLAARGYNTATLRPLLGSLALEGYRTYAENVIERFTTCEDELRRGDSYEAKDLQAAEFVLLEEADGIRAGLDTLVRTGVSTDRVQAVRSRLPHRTRADQHQSAQLSFLLRTPERFIPEPFQDPRLDALDQSVRESMTMTDMRKEADLDARLKGFAEGERVRIEQETRDKAIQEEWIRRSQEHNTELERVHERAREGIRAW